MASGHFLRTLYCSCKRNTASLFLVCTPREKKLQVRNGETALGLLSTADLVEEPQRRSARRDDLALEDLAVLGPDGVGRGGRRRVLRPQVPRQRPQHAAKQEEGGR